MNKKEAIFILLVIGIFLLALAYAESFNDIAQSDFKGTFNSTFYNSSGFIQLNNTIEGTTVYNYTNISEMNGNESGLVSYWRFNEIAWNSILGEAKDVLGKNNGTALSGANTTSGLFGNAGNFSGTTGTYVNEVQIKNAEELNPGTGSFTITGWAKSIQKGGASQWQLYVAKRSTIATDGYYLGLLEGSGLNFMVGDGTKRNDTRNNISAGTYYINVSYNKWFHFAGVVDRDSNKIYLYVNGTLSAVASISGFGNINNSWNLSIGNDEGQAIAGFNYPVNGSIDEVAIWNYALNSSEILNLYNKGINSTINSTANATYFYSGTYESEVKDAGGIVEWGNISWNGLIIGLGELPDNQGKDSSANMSGNVLLMHLNEVSGTIIDSSGNGNNGSTINGVSYGVSGKYENALSFDGADNYLNITHSITLNLGNTLTVEAWIYPKSLINRTVIFSTRVNNPAGSWQLEVGRGNAHNKVVVVAGVNTWVAESINNTVTLNAWNHIVYTRNGTGTGTHKIYVNGQLQSLQTETAYDFVDNSNPKMIGAGTILLGDHFFNGTIDEVAVYNRTLSDAEVLERYNRNSSGDGTKFQFRISNDNSSWSEYKGSDGSSGTYYSSPGSLNLSNSRYIQYKAYFENSLAKLYNVSLDYTSSGSSLFVSLDSPADNYLTNLYNGINITCSASSTSQLANITPYYSKFGWMPSESARQISGTTNTTTFTFNEINSEILWNCYACTVDGNCSFASQNKTIIGDISSPEINLVSPSNNYIENSSQIINFTFNSTDNRAETLNCSLLIDNEIKSTNSSIINGLNSIFSYTLSNGNYTWKINCSDGINSALSEERNLSVNILTPYTPFWAKANTHTHTTNSDGDGSPTIVVGLYKNLSYNIIAITDHGYVTNCTPFTNLSADFICINSEEWTSTKHVVRVNVSAPYDNSAINLQNAVNAANNEGGFAIAAHPNWSSTIWSVGELTSLQNYTAMEIYNKVIERLTPDPYAVDKWDSVLKTGKKIFGVAADDMHQVNVDLGYGFTKVYMPEFTKQDYINSMRTGYFYSSQGLSMDSEPFKLVCDGIDSYHMGETANCSAIKVNATISATNSTFVMKNITLIKDGNIINITSCSSQNCRFSYSENVSSSGYYRLEAIDSNNKKIWSNPIWVTKIALPVTITINSPENNSNINDYTPLLNISLNQETSLWYNINNGQNVTLCNGCSSYLGYLTLPEGSNEINVYANNSDNIIKLNKVYTTLNFNKTISDNFEDNSSVESTSNVFWDNGGIHMNSSNMFGNFVLKPVITTNNITSFSISWTENNTENAKGEGQRVPIILKYKINKSDWIHIDNDGDYIVSGSNITRLNGNNLSVMFDFEKNSITSIDLLSFEIIWTEFTIPLIMNLAESTTTSSATITWETDVDSNSSVEYGNSVLLGSITGNSNFVTSHSLNILNLNQNTVYYYKIKSCTVDSCAEYPQIPYPVDSFTTQSTSNPPSGGGGGGGGGGSNPTPSITPIGKLELTKLSSIILISGESKKVNLGIKNSGFGFLTDCKIAKTGAYSSWITTNSVKSLSAGESGELMFEVSVPDNANAGKYDLGISVLCKENSNSTIFSVEVAKKQLKFDFVEAKRQGNDKLIISYYLEELSGKNQDVELQFLLIDSDNKNVAEFSDKKTIGADEKQLFETSIPIDSSLAGALNLLVNLNSESFSTFVQERLVLGKGVSGFAIFSTGNIADNILAFAVIFVFAIFLIFIVIRIIKLRNRNKIRAKAFYRVNSF